jgi:hypothetical protein
MLFGDLTADWLKETYLYRIPISYDNDFLTDDVLNFYINSAKSQAEILLGIDIDTHKDNLERHDYRLEEWTSGYGFLQMYKRPCIRVKSLQLNIITSTIDIPNEWIQLKKKNSQIQLIPYYGILASASIGNQLIMFMPLLSSTTYVPQIVLVKYDSGFEAGDEIPGALAQLIGNVAASGVLAVLGEIALGGQAALAGYSIGVDGLSQSVSTTLSAENHAYSARVRQYERENQTLVKMLKDFYYGLRMAALA